MDQLARVRRLGGAGEQAIGAQTFPTSWCAMFGQRAGDPQCEPGVFMRTGGVAEVLMLTRVAECDPHRRVRKGLIECVLRARGDLVERAVPAVERDEHHAVVAVQRR